MPGVGVVTLTMLELKSLHPFGSVGYDNPRSFVTGGFFVYRFRFGVLRFNCNCLKMALTAAALAG